MEAYPSIFLIEGGTTRMFTGLRTADQVTVGAVQQFTAGVAADPRAKCCPAARSWRRLLGEATRMSSHCRSTDRQHLRLAGLCQRSIREASSSILLC